MGGQGVRVWGWNTQKLSLRLIFRLDDNVWWKKSVVTNGPMTVSSQFIKVPDGPLKMKENFLLIIVSNGLMSVSTYLSISLLVYCQMHENLYVLRKREGKE